MAYGVERLNEFHHLLTRMTILVSSLMWVIKVMVGKDSSEPTASLISLPVRWPSGRTWRGEQAMSWKEWQIVSRALEEGSHQMVTERSRDSKHSCVEFQTNPCRINLCPCQYMFPTPEKPLTETTDPEVWILTLPSWLISFHRFSEYLYQIQNGYPASKQL